MGMFDDVKFTKAPVTCKCGHKLTYFQTKQFDCNLEEYRITKTGKFKVEKWKMEEIPAEERKKSNFYSMVRKIRIGWRYLKDTLELYCYSPCDKCMLYWYDLYVNICKGQVKNIKINKRKTNYQEV